MQDAMALIILPIPFMNPRIVSAKIILGIEPFFFQKPANVNLGDQLPMYCGVSPTPKK